MLSRIHSVLSRLATLVSTAALVFAGEYITRLPVLHSRSWPRGITRCSCRGLCQTATGFQGTGVDEESHRIRTDFTLSSRTHTVIA
ncbi:hypothetical protein BC827DRAFT_1161695 [Russula dissimulans]|nr:hypothetical protein BC827DRAFT_1161695 [Russula dissimulans]